MMDMEKAVDILSFSIVNGLKSMMNISLKNNNYIVNILSFLFLLAKAGTDFISHNMACC